MGRITKGNVLFDLGLEPDEAAELAIKTDVVNELERQMQARGWNQTQLGRAIGMQRADVSRLLNRNLERYSIDRLLRAVRMLGVRPIITFLPAEPATTAG